MSRAESHSTQASDTKLIACRTIEREIERAMEDTGCFYETIYLESGLHERPQKLARILQETLDATEAGRMLVCLGRCGNALPGLFAGKHTLILPRIDDCLSLLLGSDAEKNRLAIRDGAFFVTMGWMQGELTVDREYARLSRRYGEARALSVMKTMYAHYRTVGLLDTGVSPMEELRSATAPMAELLHFEQRAYPATLSYLHALLTGPWDSGRFIVKAPGETVTEQDYRPQPAVL